MMGQAAALWAGVPRGHKIMLWAIAALFLSQCLPYVDGKDAYLSRMTDERSYTGFVPGQVEMTGWDLHPHAPFILAGLLAVFATPLSRIEGLRGWVFWAAIPAFVAASIPTALLDTPGSALGLLSLALAIWAAFANRKARVVQ